MATGLALAVLSGMAAPVSAQQNEIVVAQAQDAEALEKFNKVVSDTRPLTELTDKELTQRLSQIRSLLANKSMTKAQIQQLRKLAQAARQENQKRRAAKNQAGQQQAAAEDEESAAGGSESAPSGGSAAGQTAAQGGNAAAEVEKYVAATADVSKLSEKELRNSLRTGRNLLANTAVPRSEFPKIRDRQKALRAALEKLASGQAAAPSQPAETQQPSSETQQQGQVVPSANEAQQAAQKILDDGRTATSLSTADLENRLRSMRVQLAGGTLPAATVKQLRLKLAKDRAEFRRRKAAEQAGTGSQQPGSGTQQPGQGQAGELQSDDFYLKDTRRAATLSTRELERRVLVRRIAIVDTRYPAAERNRWKEANEIDRAELRRRAIADRDKRRDEWRKRRASGELNISINVDLGSPDIVRGRPRPIYLAEADDDEIERYLVAAPVAPPPRRYTVEEVRANREVRETMPAIEIDTIKFGFNEDFVREEALEDLDRVGEIIEKVLTAHPREVFFVEGHTDAVGSDEYNLDLSRRRAESVKQALTTYYDIDPRNIVTAGYGERYLRIQTPEAEEENRRVTIRRATPLVGELQ
jgi:outer membrane protein OmpA-like peptidoglycan-associated protein